MAPKPTLPPRPSSSQQEPPAAAEVAPERPTDLALSDAPQPAASGTPSAESPEKLSLKARLKLFEKEIEQQGSAPQPKPGKALLVCGAFDGFISFLPLRLQ